MQDRLSSTILLAGRAEGDIPSLVGLVGILAFGVASCSLFLAAERVSNWLGVMGNIVLTRLLGVILAALAIQFVIDGVMALARG